MQKQSFKGFFKKRILRNFAKFTGKHVLESLFFDKGKLFRSAAPLKARLQRRCFLVNSAKFVRTPFLQNTTRRRLLIITVSAVLVMNGQLESETVNYDAKIMYQFDPEMQLITKSLQAKQQVSETVARRLQFLKIS